MSMNLIFEYKGKGGGFFEFPFQTSTDLTFRVLNKQTKKEQIEEIQNALKEIQWMDDEYRQSIMDEVEQKLSDELIKLSMI